MIIWRDARGRFARPSRRHTAWTGSRRLTGRAFRVVLEKARRARRTRPRKASHPSGRSWAFPRQYRSPFRKFLRGLRRRYRGRRTAYALVTITSRRDYSARPRRYFITPLILGPRTWREARLTTHADVAERFSSSPMSAKNRLVKFHGVFVLLPLPQRRGLRVWGADARR